MIPRVLEPEVMDTAQEATDYDAMDHVDVNRRFIDDFLAAAIKEGDEPALCATADATGDATAAAGSETTVLDVGTGTAQIPIELCRRGPQWRVIGVDLAEAMLRLGERNIGSAGLTGRITLQRTDAKGLTFTDATFDAVMSNSIVHHIPEPRGVLSEMARVLRPGGVLFVRDLLRPESEAEVERLVARYAGEESADQRQLLRQSLWAALTVEELAELIAGFGWPRGWLTQTSDRHWTLSGRLSAGGTGKI